MTIRSSKASFRALQGSVLGPTLYSLFTHDMPTANEIALISRQDLLVATFADDTAIFAKTNVCMKRRISCRSTSSSSKTEKSASLPFCLRMDLRHLSSPHMKRLPRSAPLYQQPSWRGKDPPGKPEHDPDSYQPISRLPVLPKVWKRLVAARLMDIAKSWLLILSIHRDILEAFDKTIVLCGGPCRRKPGI